MWHYIRSIESIRPREEEFDCIRVRLKSVEKPAKFKFSRLFRRSYIVSKNIK